MTYTYDADSISDIHKDAYGMRPSGDFWDCWNTADDDTRQLIWDNLCDAARSSAEIERSIMESCIKDFEDEVSMLIAKYPISRSDALRWISDAAGCIGDWDGLCWKRGLPFGYFKNA